ncbi:MAG: hypothetical protein RL685_6866 [Pseudomonadota bacterium]|jgi:hypothetical protein
MLSITGRAGQGRGLFVAALVVTTVLACEPKVYPDAQPETRAPLETEILEAEMEPTLVDAGCTPVTLFRDRDGDTYGSNAEED